MFCVIWVSTPSNNVMIHGTHFLDPVVNKGWLISEPGIYNYTRVDLYWHVCNVMAPPQGSGVWCQCHGIIILLLSGSFTTIA